MHLGFGGFVYNLTELYVLENVTGFGFQKLAFLIHLWSLVYGSLFNEETLVTLCQALCILYLMFDYYFGHGQYHFSQWCYDISDECI